MHLNRVWLYGLHNVFDEFLRKKYIFMMFEAKILKSWATSRRSTFRKTIQIFNVNIIFHNEETFFGELKVIVRSLSFSNSSKSLKWVELIHLGSQKEDFSESRNYFVI